MSTSLWWNHLSDHPLVQKNTSFYYFKYDIPHTSDNLATLGAVYNHRVIQVNRLSQVLDHRDKFKSRNASYRLEDSVVSMPYIAFNARAKGSTASWSLTIL